ncbi:sensor histidine kinase [Solitalea koreensis]|uniref:sensor histidine kinase n=1 Tax=Solitalea koreensis TaxID=543615 RepID=UPI001FEA93B9|nr:histidine kinase N-terminal 7TM domain-containing protein [Solitalea koreensis]
MFKKLGSVVRWFSLLMLLIAIWAITYSFELSCRTLPDMLFWINFEYIGIALLPATWIIFIIHFIGKENWLNKTIIALIYLIPIITIGMVWTNSLHHLHYTLVGIDTMHDFPLLSIEFGIWYRIFTVYFYILLALGGYLLIRTFKQADTIYKKQNSSILLGALIPWMFNLFYMLGIRPLEHIDLTPFAFIITGLLISLGLMQYRLFDLIPIGREKVINSMHDGFLILDHQDRVIDYNKNILHFLSHSASSTIIGITLAELFKTQNQLLETVQKRINGNVEIQIRTNSRTSYFDIAVTSLFKKNTIYSGVVLIFRDITELKNDAIQLKNQSEQLSDLNQLKDRIFTIISHDLRTPFNQLHTALNMTLKGMLSKQELSVLLPELAECVKQTSGILDNLLSWSKTQMNGELTEARTLNLLVLAKTEMELLLPGAKEKNIAFKCKIEPSIYVFADKEMIKLIFRNLINNAIKFSNQGDTITIYATPKDNFVEICIEDSGTGMRPETLSNLFSAKTFSTPGTHNEQGTGLGLLFCKDFVEKNNGKIWADSSRLQGSRFYFTLPEASMLSIKHDSQVHA